MSLCKILLLCLIFFLNVNSLLFKKLKQKPVIDYRLPLDLKPYFYDIQLKPYIGNLDQYGNKSFTFEGEIFIHFNCIVSTNKIILHQINLEFNQFNLTSFASNESISIIDIHFDKIRDFVIFNLDNYLSITNYTIYIKYNGIISDSLYGFYKSSYTDKSNKTYFLATTQFQPIEARKAFPCFDEPSFKAQFQMTIIRHKNFSNSLFNSPLIKTIQHPKDEDWEIDYFEKTVPMSTYLVAFVISNFERIKKYSPKYNIEIEVAARPDAIQAGELEFALDLSLELIDFFSDYFNIPYALTKSTQVAVPDFSAGAMENFGLNMYRERNLLFDKEMDSINNLKFVKLVVCHELAHQWFGNLVTPEWWNDIWLNEGFASWMEQIGGNKTHPEWRDLDYLLLQTFQTMVSDSLEISHPISFELNNPKDLTILFDAISYHKGSNVIRMMNAFLTEETFKKGVTNYLNKYKYSNAKQDNLWEELTKQAHLDNTLDINLNIKDIMDTWTLQKGYPVVHINIQHNINNQSFLLLTIKQEWFLLNRIKTNSSSSSSNNNNNNNNNKWYIPFTYTTSNELNFNFETKPTWIKPNDTNINVYVNITTNLNDNQSNDTYATHNNTSDNYDNEIWIIGNIKHSGFYRVNYDMNNWNLLIKQLTNDYNKINVINRAQLLDDSFNLGRSGLIDQTIFLRITNYLVNESDPLVFQTAFIGLNYIADMLSYDTKAFQSFKNYYTSLLKKTYNKLKWESNLTDINDISLQLKVIQVMCLLGEDQDCINDAKYFYELWKQNKSSVPEAFYPTILCTVLKKNNESDWFYIYDLALNIHNSAERFSLIGSLTCANDISLLEFLLQQTLEEKKLKTQDESILHGITNNYIGRRLAFSYMFDSWESLLEKYEDTIYILVELVDCLTSKLNTEYDLKKLKQFIELKEHTFNKQLQIAFEHSIETVELNIIWTEMNLNNIKSFLGLWSK